MEATAAQYSSIKMSMSATDPGIETERWVYG